VRALSRAVGVPGGVGRGVGTGAGISEKKRLGVDDGSNKAVPPVSAEKKEKNRGGKGCAG
jgi:hypothetical protein